MGMKLRSGRVKPSEKHVNGEYSSLGTSAERVADASTWTTVSLKDLPEFLRDNEFLLHGHRPELRSFYTCFKSVLRIHTETGNIWTHLIGSLGFLLFSVVFIGRPPESVSLAEKLTFSVFFLGAILCMGMSTIFHTVYCHSKETACTFSKLDYVGIIILIVSSFVPWLYFGFYCESKAVQIGYMASEVTIGMLCVIAVLDSRFNKPKYRPARAVLFVCLGLTGVVPAIHFVIHNGIWASLRFFIWLILMAVSYIFGAIIYALRVPERLSPGAFDIWGQSHQILHLCVIAGALICYHGAADLARTRLASPEPCVLPA